jgi:Flp pilus assembly protein TadD
MSNNSQSVDTAIKHGRRLLVEGRHEETSEFFEEAVQRFPDDPEIRLLYATSLVADHPADVAEQVAKAINLDPDEPIRLTRAAGLVFNMGEIEAARSYATRAKELAKPGFFFLPELINVGGLIAAHDGDDALAEEALRVAVEEEPGREAFVRDLAKFLADRDRGTEALEVVDRALTVTKEKEKIERLRGEITGQAASDNGN